MPVNLKPNIPNKQLNPPNNIPYKKYCEIFPLKFLLAQAGIATKAAVINPPTILAPKDTMIAMQNR